MVRSLMRCPVCNYLSSQNDEICGRCGTIFSLFSENGNIEELPVVPVEEDQEEDADKSNRHQLR